VQQTAKEKPGFTGTYPGAVKMSSARRSNNRLYAPGECSQFVAKAFQPKILHFVTQERHIYEIYSRKDKCGVDLISDALSFGRLGYAESNAIANAVGYAKFRSRSHDAVIRVYDGAGNIIETHEHAGDFSRVLTADREGPGIKRGLTWTGDL
jgi:hypothetical protein